MLSPAEFMVGQKKIIRSEERELKMAGFSFCFLIFSIFSVSAFFLQAQDLLLSGVSFLSVVNPRLAELCWFMQFAYFSEPTMNCGGLFLQPQASLKSSKPSQGPYPGGVRERPPLQALHGISAGGPEASLRNNGTFEVLLGAHSLSETEPNKRLYGVRRLIPHPGSSQDTILHDLLLIQLAEPAVLGPHVQILPYQTVNNDVPEHTRCEVAGWGIISNTGKKPDKLQFVHLRIINRNQCNSRRHHDGSVTENMMCAESRKKDSCKGDSGGPIVCNGIAEGVVTTGSTICGNWRKPGIYTRTAPYVSWINSTIESNN